MQKKLLSLVLTLMMTGTSQAQDIHPQEDIVCAGRVISWSGTVDETKSIKMNPVPDSFAKRFDGVGAWCSSLDKTSILIWHRDFGNALTMRTAIEFLSADILKQLDRPFSPSEPEDIEFQSKAYAKIANYYLLGAEAHESVAAIDEAITYLKKANALAKKIPPNESAVIYKKPGMASEYFFYINGNPLEDLHLSLALLSQDIYVMRAYLTGDEESLIFAENLLEDLAPRFVEETLRAAADTFEPICETQDETLQKKMKKACGRTTHDYEDLVRDYLFKKALLATVKESLSDATYPDQSNRALNGVLLLLLNSERQGTYSPLDRHNPHKSLWFKALIAHSDAYLTLGNKRSDVELIIQGLELLVYAERYVPRHASPAQWKKLATRYIKASATLTENNDEEIGKYAGEKWYWVQHYNQLKYFQNGLAALENKQ